MSTGWMSLKLFIFLRWKFINQTIKIIRIKRLVVFETLHVSLMKWSNLVKVKQQPTFWNDSGMHLSRNLLQCSSFSVRSLVGKKKNFEIPREYRTNEAIETWKYWGQATPSNRVEVCKQIKAMPIRRIFMKSL